MKLFCTAAVILFVLPVCATSAQDADAVTINPASQSGVEIRIAGKPFATYRANFNGRLPKPFLLPVRTADGTVLTRSLKDPEDHPHHKGVWVSVDEVNEVKFWAEKGHIRTKRLLSRQSGGADQPAQVHVQNVWMTLDEKPVVDEETRIAIYPNRLLTYDITFVARYGPVEFGDTKEGLFGFRMVNALREKETGKVVNADGKQGTKDCWGQPSPWVDYYGKINEKTYGLALFDHPKNFRKSRYHVRNYGLFSVSPFGAKAYSRGKEDAQPAELAKGEKLQLRYALYIHNGDTEAGKVAETYKQYAQLAGAEQ